MAGKTQPPPFPTDTSPYFSPADFGYPKYESSIPTGTDLKNENLFPISKVRFASKSPSVYSKLEPALLLASRMILEMPQTFSMVIERKQSKHDYIEEDDIVPRDSQAIRSIVRSFAPEIDIDPEMSARSVEYAMTYLEPSKPHDLVLLDYNLIRAVRDIGASHRRRTVVLFTTAVLLCHEMAHILEFRSIRKGELAPSGEPYQSPPGITCTEVGAARETRMFGGVIRPICEIEGDLSTIIGLAARSQSWNGHAMAIKNDWIVQLFFESFWVSEPQTLRVPYQPILSTSPRCNLAELDEEDELFLLSPHSLQSPNKRLREGRREIVVGDFERRPNRRNDRYSMREPRKCGKRVLHGEVGSRRNYTT